ncbi:hypothetical protein M0811_14238 [Anaeramoeba ignava]|uniref:Uncharacterized protein n=1 Tax=Anaeramoeba ignava TaxID=1746090 RepID=A0A9Q0LZA2_ANAIG|nr:hypothetical protein M0811_14238 [Anaeramoeba ignava]
MFESKQQNNQIQIELRHINQKFKIPNIKTISYKNAVSFCSRKLNLEENQIYFLNQNIPIKEKEIFYESINESIQKLTEQSRKICNNYYIIDVVKPDKFQEKLKKQEERINQEEEEKERIRQQKENQERIRQQEQERMRIEKENQERIRIEQENQERIRIENQERIRREQERIQQQEQERIRREQERIRIEKENQERIQQQEQERIRREQERIRREQEKERIRREQERIRIEKQNQERIRIESEREQERIKREKEEEERIKKKYKAKDLNEKTKGIAEFRLIDYDEYQKLSNLNYGGIEIKFSFKNQRYSIFQAENWLKEDSIKFCSEKFEISRSRINLVYNEFVIPNLDYLLDGINKINSFLNQTRNNRNNIISVDVIDIVDYNFIPYFNNQDKFYKIEKIQLPKKNQLNCETIPIRINKSIKNQKEIKENITIKIEEDTFSETNEIQIIFMKEKNRNNHNQEIEENPMKYPFDISTKNKEQPKKPVEIIFESKIFEIEEGNTLSLFHYNEEKKEWEEEEENIFISPETGKLKVVLNHFSIDYVKKIKPPKIDLDEKVFDPNWNVFWPEDYSNEEFRGGMRYYVARGFERQALLIPDFYKYEDWCVAFHGTAYKVLDPIVGKKEGLIIGNNNAHGKGIYCSPSYKYASIYGIGAHFDENKNLWVYPKYTSWLSRTMRDRMDNETYITLLILQLRVKLSNFNPYPGGYFANKDDYDIFPETFSNTGYCCNDRNFNSNEIEWRIKDPKNIKVYGILTRTLTLKEFKEWIKKK